MIDWQLLDGAASDSDQHLAERYPYGIAVRPGCIDEDGAAWVDPYQQGILLTVAEVDALHKLAHEED